MTGVLLLLSSCSSAPSCSSRAVAAGTDGVRHRRPRVTGLGCYALLPLTISLSQEQLVAMPSMVAGAIFTSLTSSHAG